MTLALLPGEGARRQRYIFSGHSFWDNGRLVYPPPAGEVPVPCGGPGPAGGQRETGGLRQSPGRDWRTGGKGQDSHRKS